MAKKRVITAEDVPDLLHQLNSGDADSKQRALQLLCPCRNRVYDRQVWVAIFDVYEHGDTGNVRDQAGHAIGTLLERARTDPRSQELLQWLSEQGVKSHPVEDAIPVWRPNLRG